MFKDYINLKEININNSSNEIIKKLFYYIIIIISNKELSIYIKF